MTRIRLGGHGLAAGAVCALGLAAFAGNPVTDTVWRDQKVRMAKNAPVNGDRVRKDMDAAGAKGDVTWYVVPAMSDVMRLSDTYPQDGRFAGEVRATLAGNESEAASFQLFSFADADKVDVRLSDLTCGGSKLAADLRVVKLWFQNGNGWVSYFDDSGLKLIPELLLHDENLIRVDEGQMANYARLTAADGTVTERWINPPRQMDNGFFERYCGSSAFQSMKREFSDADAIRPIGLKRGAFKNLILTAHVRKTTPAGLYRGAVRLGSLGEVPVTVRVLDFELPKPACFFDDTKPFLVNFYTYSSLGQICDLNGGDTRLAIEQFKAIMKDYAAHGQDVFWLSGGPTGHTAISAEAAAQLAAMREAGMNDEQFVCGANIGNGATKTEAEAGARRSFASSKAFFGPNAKDIYMCHGDEPPPQWLKDQRGVVAAAQRAGYKFILAGSDNIFRKSAYQWDWHNIAKTPEDGSSTTAWNLLGGDKYVAWYANQHVGAENPAFNRRQNGLAAYLANYSALCNYAHHFGSYDDDSEIYRPMVFAYGQGKGVIDTIQWEGFREGVDDIRYATLLVRLARAAAKLGVADLDASYEGRKALQFLAAINRETDDLDACRAEMITFILRLKKVLGK